MERLSSFFFAPLKRLYLFLLKRAIGKFIKTRIETDQFDVQLSSGTVELFGLEFNCDVRCASELIAGDDV
jgi:hypothetical protein